jgi:hypothetical protein
MDFLDKMLLMVLNVHKLDKKQQVVMIHLIVVEIEQLKQQLMNLIDDVVVIYVH